MMKVTASVSLLVVVMFLPSHFFLERYFYGFAGALKLVVSKLARVPLTKAVHAAVLFPT